MSDTIRTLSTAGLTPRRQIQRWSDALTDLCGRFDIDTLQASSLEGRMALTAVSHLKLCQIELSPHRIAHSARRASPGDHPYVKIHFQTAGISHFDQDGKQIELAPGDCLSYDVARPHAMISTASTRHDVVIVPKTLLDDRGVARHCIPTAKLSARTGAGRIAHDFVRAAFDQAAELSPQSAVRLADSMIDVLMLPLFEAGTRGSRGRSDAAYLRARHFIREHLRDPDLCLDRICAELGCSKRYLHMLFSDRGATVSDHIWQTRLSSCRQEIEANAGKKITDIAFSWGFSSSSHFSRMFRKYFGIAPSSIHKARVSQRC
ncbi:MAG: helix-turn-helix domain-containing protein [Alphaproteobacteria bacterium]|nr:helix-turn-helix domain-containing protein [Alphaproteobacteria bacterium]